jgi:hypothetical protein
MPRCFFGWHISDLKRRKTSGRPSREGFSYKRAPDVELWEDRFITMAQDIKRNIRKLDVFIRNNY